MLTRTRPRQLYGWHVHFLLLGLMKHRAIASADQRLADESGSELTLQERQSGLFLALARSAGNPEHIAALEALGQRLAPIQRLEQAFLDGTEAETAEIVRALQARDRKALRRNLVRYHRRREKIVPELLAGLLQA